MEFRERDARVPCSTASFHFSFQFHDDARPVSKRKQQFGSSSYTVVIVRIGRVLSRSAYVPRAASHVVFFYQNPWFRCERNLRAWKNVACNKNARTLFDLPLALPWVYRVALSCCAESLQKHEENTRNDETRIGMYDDVTFKKDREKISEETGGTEKLVEVMKKFMAGEKTSDPGGTREEEKSGTRRKRREARRKRTRGRNTKIGGRSRIERVLPMRE